MGLGTLVAAAQDEQFDIVLVDDLSRVARDNYLLLSVIAELHFEGVRVVSVADGLSLTRIVRMLNEEKVPGRMRAAKGWSPATVSRILDNEKYVGRRVWNKTESRRDPRTGRRRRFTKPEAEWVVQKDESLRIVPEALWERVRARWSAGGAARRLPR